MTTEAQKRANAKYFKDNYSQVKLSMPNDEAAALRQYCADHDLTVAGFIRELVRNAIAAGTVSGADPVRGTAREMDTVAGGRVSALSKSE